MPTYIYQREDGSTFEIQQRITEDALAECPETGQKVKRVITAPAVHFKGSGFYKTDYTSSGGGSSSDSSGSNGGESSGGDDSSSSAAACDGTGPKGGCGACSDD